MESRASKTSQAELVLRPCLRVREPALEPVVVAAAARSVLGWALVQSHSQRGDRLSLVLRRIGHYFRHVEMAMVDPFVTTSGFLGQAAQSKAVYAVVTLGVQHNQCRAVLAVC